MNILHGQSAGGSFKTAFNVANDEILIFHDVLSCGPLIKYTDHKEWKTFRESYWNEIHSDNTTEKRSFEPPDRDFYNNFDEIAEQRGQILNIK